jgi:hypothetical protein
MAAYWVYQVYHAVPPAERGNEEILMEEPGEVTDNSESTDDPFTDSESKLNGDITVTLEDPNVEPYHVFVSFSIQGNVLFNLEPPDRMTLSDIHSNTILEFTSGPEANTNLSGKSLSYSVFSNPCELDSNLEWNTINLGGIDFMKGMGEEGAAGHRYVTYSYAMEHQGRCILFTLVLNLVNASLVETPLSELDTTIEMKKLEDQLATIELQ